jgi:hypothetical protein
MSAKFPLIVSYHTPFEVYEKCARELEDGLKEFGLRYEINCLPSEGDWYQNVCQKTSYIRDMMDKHPNDDIVWIDADSTIKAYPELFGRIKADVACPLWEGKSIMASTMFFRNTEKVRRFVDCWIELTYLIPYDFVPDQTSFSQLLKRYPQVSFEIIPESYSFVENCSREKEYQDGPPVIVANLISRSVARKVPE